MGRVQLLFFLSGATGLIYQILWTRRLTLTFGHTALAVSTVLTAFMGGLALGSLLAGRWADRTAGRKLLRAYGYLEGFIGLWALLTLPLLGLVEDAYVALAGARWSCFLGAAVVLLPPTTAMGATLPILTRLLTQQYTELGPMLSRLYGLNTLGALAGAAATGFWLLPGLGLTRTLFFGVAVNLLIMVVAVSMAGGKRRHATQVAAQETARDWLIPLTLGLGGVASMAYQVGWTRALSLSIGSSTYAFTTILVAFLAGLGLGSLVYAKLITRVPSAGHLARLYLALALFGGATIPAAGWLPELFYRLFAFVQDDFGALVALNLGLAGLLLLGPTFLMGLAFPLATSVYATGPGRLGRSVGEIYSANTLGCIVGAFLTGFVVIPNWGAQWALKAATLLYLLNVLLLVRRSRAVVAGACALSFVVVTVALPPWDPGVMSAGVAVYSADHAEQGWNPSRFGSSPGFYRDGLSATVSLHYAGERFQEVSMRVNGKADASTGREDRQTQYLLGYLPLLLHPEPRNVAVIGLGGGFTLEAVATFTTVERLECAELEPAVVEAARYWNGHNGRVLEDPRVSLHVTDGRTFVLGSSRRYDVIVSEPSNPWIAGIGNLFTRDFYQTARERLTEDGVMCQWFNLYAVSEADVRMVLRGFFEVFPFGQVWQTSTGDLALLGSTSPLTFDLDRCRRAWEASPAMRRHFFENGLFFPESLAGQYLGGREQAMALGRGAVLNTDDHPRLEFSAPLSLYREDQVWRNTELIWSAFKPALPPGCPATPELLIRALFGLVNTGRTKACEIGLRQLEGDPSPEWYAAAALVAGLKRESIQVYREALSAGLARYPEHPLLASLLGDLEFAHREWERSAKLYLTALADPPEGARVHLLTRLGEALMEQKDHRRAIRPLLEAAQAAPAGSAPLALLGHNLVGMQEDGEALKVFDKALERDPFDPYAHLGLAYAAFNTGDPALAEAHLLQLLALAPDSSVGWLKLGYCREALGDEPGRREAFRRLKELEPWNPIVQEKF